jgi:hypothetical protein
MNMSYADLLKDRRWQKKRLEVLDAAELKCSSCGSVDPSVPLHVHHKIYVRGRMPWEYNVDELDALCDMCHKNATNWGKFCDALIEIAKIAGPERFVPLVKVIEKEVKAWAQDEVVRVKSELLVK